MNISPDPPRTPAAPRCNDRYPFVYTSAGLEHRLCELPKDHDGNTHQWQGYYWHDEPLPQALPPDQMTALERQLTAEVEQATRHWVMFEGETHRWQDRAEKAEAAIVQTWQPEVKALGIYVKRLQAERDQMRAVVEAARAELRHDCQTCREVWCAEREELVARVYSALDALDGSHAAQNAPVPHKQL